MPSGDDGPHGPWEDWRDASPGQGLKQALERARAEQEDIQRRRRRKSPHSTLRSALSIAVIAMVIELRRWEPDYWRTNQARPTVQVIDLAPQFTVS